MGGYQMSQMFGDRIKQLQQQYFVGRDNEYQTFLDLAKNKNEARILNIFGIGGLGKSTLLDEFQKRSFTENIHFIFTDSHDFTHTKEGFAHRILTLCKASTIDNLDLVSTCIEVLNNLAGNHTIVLAVDTYEDLGDMDNWLREQFISRLTSNILIILSGRTPLKGKWISSPAWRSLIKFMEITPFSMDECKFFLEKCNIHEQDHIESLFTFTQGHPLTLTLAASLTRDTINDEKQPETMHQVLQQTTAHWLRELPDSTLSRTVEATAFVRVFDQDILEHILETKLSTIEFNQLTNLSFIRKKREGWSIHDLLRKSLIQELQARSPYRYKSYWSKSIDFLLMKIKSDPESIELMSELLFVLGDSHIRSTYLNDRKENTYFLQPVHSDNHQEATAYVEKLKKEKNDLYDEFIDQVTNERHELVRPFAADQALLSYIDIEEILGLGGDGIFLLKDEHEEIGGLMVLLPIHKESLSYLLKKPIARHYFQLLTQNKLKDLQVPKNKPAGWFIFHIDLKNDNSAAARALCFQKILSFLIKGGLFVFSTPIQYMQQTVLRLGFQEIPASTHHDFGQDFPAPFYEIDLREERRFLYVNELVKKAGITTAPELPQELHILTQRELEVAEAVIKHNTIADISSALYVTQITVKKHLSKLYEKLEVQGKSALIKKLYEIGFRGKDL
jgi:DNA-binding CsgD family transcriptional regulator